MQAVRNIALVALLLATGCTQFPQAPATGEESAADVGVDVPDAMEASDAALDRPEGDIESSDDAAVAPCLFDGDCDDGLWCTGFELCAPESARADAKGCVAFPHPEQSDGVPCTADQCSEGSRLVTHVPTEACGCQADVDCAPDPSFPCRVPTCHEGQCVLVPASEGHPCDTGESCVGAGACNAVGVCEAAQPRCECAADSECPATQCGQPICDGGVCAAIATGRGCVPDEIQVSVQAQGAAGLREGEGVLATAVTRQQGVVTASRSEDVYCQVREVVDRVPMASDAVFREGRVLPAGDLNGFGDQVRAGLPAVDGTPGLVLCDGYGVELGPFYPPTEQHAVLVSVRLGLPQDVTTHAAAPHSMIVAVRGPAEIVGQESRWLQMGAYRSQDLEDPVALAFIVEPEPGTPAWVRVQGVDDGGGDPDPGSDCFWLGDVVVSAAPLESQTGLLPMGCVVNDEIVDCDESFSGRQASYAREYFTLGDAAVATLIVTTPGLVGDSSAIWRFESLPEDFLLGPVLEPVQAPRRDGLLVASFAMDLLGTTVGPEALYVELVDKAGHSTALGSSSQAGQHDWLIEPTATNQEDREKLRRRMVLPEAAKAAADQRLRWNMRYTGADTLALLDEIQIGHLEPTDADPIVTEEGNARRVRAPRGGKYEVRCAWQDPETSPVTVLSPWNPFTLD